jgi:hypothetical protein
MPDRLPATRRASLALAVAASVALLAGASALAQAPPQHDPTKATIEFEGGAVAIGVGFSWGGGTLHYGGKSYPIRVNGLSALDVGASKYSASGTVTHLKKVSDIEGTYVAGEVGATVAGGVSAQSMKNDKGVVITFHTTRAGLQFTVAPKGATIKLK